MRDVIDLKTLLRNELSVLNSKFDKVLLYLVYQLCTIIDSHHVVKFQHFYYS